VVLELLPQEFDALLLHLQADGVHAGGVQVRVIEDDRLVQVVQFLQLNLDLLQELELLVGELPQTLELAVHDQLLLHLANRIDLLILVADELLYLLENLLCLVVVRLPLDRRHLDLVRRGVRPNLHRRQARRLEKV
jgi:hypothetical protein